MELVTAASEALLWQIRHARSRIWLASPYVSATAAKRLVEAPIECEGRLLTAVDEASVRSGVLSAKALLELRANGFEVASIENLHAKLSLVDSWGMVGSGNLTAAGLGLGGEGNVELGVELNAAQRRGAAAIFARWWSRADPVATAELERLASLPVQSPPAKGSPHGPKLALSGAEDLEAVLAETPSIAASRRYWIKANYHRHDQEDWWKRGWISDRRRASYAPGDLIFLYLSARNGGPARCPAVVRAMTTIRHDPDFVLAEGDAEAVPQWPFVTETARIAQVLPTTEGVELKTMGKTAQSLENGYCGITREQFEAGARALLDKLP
ncbi:MAG TPA: phospholipase D-like domain-containing protein [Solirubrobacterales bacterium]|nr:phospholipase D-like domain-containing protein [Solirubrobacterales bacterium]